MFREFMISTMLQTGRHPNTVSLPIYKTSGYQSYQHKVDSDKPTFGNINLFAKQLLRSYGFSQLVNFVKEVHLTGRFAIFESDQAVETEEFVITSKDFVPEDLRYLHFQIYLSNNFGFNIMDHNLMCYKQKRTLEISLDLSHDQTTKFPIIHIFQNDQYNWDNIYYFLFEHFGRIPDNHTIQFDIKICLSDSDDEQQNANYSQGRGTTTDMFRKFWSGATESHLNWFEGKTAFLPCRLTQPTSLQTMQILGRIFASSIQHDYFPSHIHFGAYLHSHVYHLDESSLIFAMTMFQNDLLQRIPLSYNEWYNLPPQQKSYITAQYQLYTIMDEFELNENNYIHFRNEAYRQVLTRHRSLASMSFSKGIDDVYSQGHLQSEGIFSSTDTQVLIDEWKRHQFVGPQDFSDTMLQVNGDMSEADVERHRQYIHMLHQILEYWEKSGQKGQDTLKQFQIFSRGSIGDRRPLTLCILANNTKLGADKTLPVALVCDPVLNIRPYASMEEMKTDLERALYELEMGLN